MIITRRTCARLLGLTAMAPSLLLAASPPPVTITDTIGRQVTLNGPLRRIVLLNALDMVSMAIVHPDPASLVVGWAGVDTFDSDLLRQQFGTRTDGSVVPVVGGQSVETISVERLLALAPDLVVSTATLEPDAGNGPLTRRLTAAGIPVIFSSAASNRQPADGADQDPFTSMAWGMRLWGTLLAQGDRAEAFLAFIHQRLTRISERLTGAPPVKAYLEVQSTYDDCCWAAGQHIWGQLLTRAGGTTLSVVTAPWYAKVAPEQLMIEAPEVYIASGGAFGAGLRPPIGPGLDPATGRSGLARLIARTGFAALPAVRARRVHGVWSGLLSIAPLNILFVEAAARWLHPDRFGEDDPATTLAEIGQRFLSRPVPAPCWLDLAPRQPASSPS